MKIGELNQHCGNCSIIDLCGEPYSEIMLCANGKLSEMEEEDYIRKVKEIRSTQKRNWGNKTLEKMIVKSLEKKGI